MNEKIKIKNVPKYLIFEKEIIDENIIDDLIKGNKFNQISFSYKTEAIIKLIYYILNYFFKNKTYGEKTLNIELYDNSKSNSYLFKFKILLPYIFKTIIKYLSITNKWFNFIFNGLELLNLINFLDTQKYKSFNYNSLLHYLLNVKYKLLDNQMDLKEEILFTNSFDILIDEIGNIISDLFYLNKKLLKGTKEEILLFQDKNKICCQICKLFPINSIYFKCGHYFCYYCYFYNSKIINKHKNIVNDKCFLCTNNLISI